MEQSVRDIITKCQEDFKSGLPEHKEEGLVQLDEEDVEKDAGCRPTDAIQQGFINIKERLEGTGDDPIDNTEKTEAEGTQGYQTIGKG